MTIREQAFSGVRWTTFSSLGRAILQFLQIAILARLLEPADFGLIALVVAILTFLQIFSDMGVSNAIVHYQYITLDQLSSLYWLNVAMSSLLALIVILASYWVAFWYQQPDLQYLLMLAALVLFVGALGQQLRVVAQKNLRFSGLAKIELSAALLGFIAAVTLASAGAGVYSLMAGTLITATTGCIFVWLYLSDGWRPVFRMKFNEIKKFMRFGAYMIGNNLVNTFNSQIDVLLGGRLVGVESIGLYSVPKDLSLRIGAVINPIITQVGLPVMAKAQGDEALLKKVYLHTMRMTTSVTFPIYIALGVFSSEIVRILLGDKWEGAIPLLQILAFWGLNRAIGNPAGSLLMARGKANLSFKWNLVWFFIIPPFIWAGSMVAGVYGMAVAMLILSVFGYWPNWYFLVRPLCGAGFYEYSSQLAVPFVLSLLAGFIAYVSVSLFEDVFSRIVVGFLVGGLVYVVLSWKFNRVWFDAMIELGLYKK